ncbi:hypothetical protein Emed_000275 [Eimeria media]
MGDLCLLERGMRTSNCIGPKNSSTRRTNSSSSSSPEAAAAAATPEAAAAAAEKEEWRACIVCVFADGGDGGMIGEHESGTFVSLRTKRRRPRQHNLRGRGGPTNKLQQLTLADSLQTLMHLQQQQQQQQVVD